MPGPVSRCAHESCKKKLRLTDWVCKCGKVYCDKHRIMDLHACGFLKGVVGGGVVVVGANNGNVIEETKRRADELRCVADKMKNRI